MMRILGALLSCLLLAGPASAAETPVIGGGTDCGGPKTRSQLTSSFDTGAICTCTDCSAAAGDCTTAGSDKVLCHHKGSGTWVVAGDQCTYTDACQHSPTSLGPLKVRQCDPNKGNCTFGATQNILDIKSEAKICVTGWKGNKMYFRCPGQPLKIVQTQCPQNFFPVGDQCIEYLPADFLLSPRRDFMDGLSFLGPFFKYSTYLPTGISRHLVTAAIKLWSPIGITIVQAFVAQPAYADSYGSTTGDEIINFRQPIGALRVPTDEVIRASACAETSSTNCKTVLTPEDELYGVKVVLETNNSPDPTIWEYAHCVIDYDGDAASTQKLCCGSGDDTQQTQPICWRPEDCLYCIDSTELDYTDNYQFAGAHVTTYFDMGEDAAMSWQFATSHPAFPTNWGSTSNCSNAGQWFWDTGGPWWDGLTRCEDDGTPDWRSYRAGHVVSDEGTPLTARGTLNFVGAGVTCTDDSGNDETDCTISGGGTGHTIKDEGTPLTARTGLNFTGGAITCTDDSGNDETDCDASSSTAGFLDAAELSAACGSSTRGKLAIRASGSVLNWCDDNATPAVAYAALGTSGGKATQINLGQCDADNEKIETDANGVPSCGVNPSGGGDSITVDGSPVVDPDFDSGGEVSFSYSSPDITAYVKADVIGLVELAGNAGTPQSFGDWTCSDASCLLNTDSVSTNEIATGGVDNAELANNAVTYAKMQDIATDSLIGRDTAGSGDPETIALGTGFSMSGAGTLNFTESNPGAQPSDATLTSLAALGTAADKMAYTTGIDTWAETAITAFGRSIIDDADEATFKATVNLEIGTDVQAYSATLGDLAADGTDFGTLTDTKFCTYDLAGTQVVCTSDAPAPADNSITEAKLNSSDTPVSGQCVKIAAGDVTAFEYDTCATGSSEWTDSGTNGVLYPNETDDEVVVGASATQGAKFAVKGDADEVQVRVIPNATQTNDVVQIRNSANSATVASIDVDGDVAANTVSTTDQTAVSGGNSWSVFENANANTPAGTAGKATFGDLDGSASTYQWCFKSGTTTVFCLPGANSSTATQALFAQATGVPQYRAIAAGDLPAHADAGSDTTTWPLLGLAQTGTQTPATDGGLTYNASTDTLSTIIAAASGSTVTAPAADTNNTTIPSTAWVQTEIQDAADDGRSLTGAATGVINADAELYTDSFSFNVEAAVTADDGVFQHKVPVASTLTRVSCSTNAGTATVSLYNRTEASPNTGTTNMMTGTLSCSTTSSNTTSFTDAAVAANEIVALGISASMTSGQVLRVYVSYTKDD